MLCTLSICEHTAHSFVNIAKVSLMQYMNCPTQPAGGLHITDMM